MGDGKCRIDWDSRVVVLKYIRKYDQYQRWLSEEREKILQPKSGEMDGMPRGNRTSDLTLSGVEALERLEQTHKARVVQAIDRAKAVLCMDIADEAVRTEMCRAIWTSCKDGKRYNFEFFAGRIPCERATFYRTKNAFLLDIKKNLGL